MRTVAISILAALLVGCFNPEDEPREEKYATTAQELVVCSSSCDPPTYNGSPVACASNTYCFSDAGGAYCLNGDGSWQVAACTTGVYCGDGICNGNEDWTTCGDCSPPIYCGDGICNGNEDWTTCGDCPPPQPFCGDGVCDAGETRFNCPSDCDFGGCTGRWCPIEP
jgi:hypothetical protein